MFEAARVKLTMWYMVIIALVCLAFSAVIYHFLTQEVERFVRLQVFRFQTVHQQVIDDSRHRIFWILMTINGVIVVASGGFGYILAGRTLRPIAEMLEEQKRFVSDASHELRTPLTSLKSAFEVFLRSPDPNKKDMVGLVEESIEEVDKLQALSESLLSLARSERANPNLKKEKVDVQTTLTAAIKKVSLRLEKKQIVLKLNLFTATIWVDRESLVGLWVILLDNAIKYSQPQANIEIKMTRLLNNLTVSIADQGTGIARRDLPRIFDRFFRTDSARKHGESGGYGLGLSIAKKIVDAQKGTISVGSRLGKGTVFKVGFSLV